MQGEKIVPDRYGEDILDYELVKDHLYHKILTDKIMIKLKKLVTQDMSEKIQSRQEFSRRIFGQNMQKTRQNLFSKRCRKRFMIPSAKLD